MCQCQRSNIDWQSSVVKLWISLLCVMKWFRYLIKYQTPILRIPVDLSLCPLTVKGNSNTGLVTADSITFAYWIFLKLKIYFLELSKKLNFKNDGVHLLDICRSVSLWGVQGYSSWRNDADSKFYWRGDSSGWKGCNSLQNGMGKNWHSFRYFT